MRRSPFFVYIKTPVSSHDVMCKGQNDCWQVMCWAMLSRPPSAAAVLDTSRCLTLPTTSSSPLSVSTFPCVPAPAHPVVYCTQLPPRCLSIIVAHGCVLLAAASLPAISSRTESMPTCTQACNMLVRCVLHELHSLLYLRLHLLLCSACSARSSVPSVQPASGR